MRGKKEVVIIRHGGGRLGNQLWLFVNIYAYCLEKKYSCSNYSFYDYRRFFNFKTPCTFTKVFELIGRFKLGWTQAHTYPLYILYEKFSHILTIFRQKSILKPSPGRIFYLPPTPIKNTKDKKMLETLEKGNNRKIFIEGQNFKNPVGIKKYHKQMVDIFRPKGEISDRIDNFLKPFRENYLVGVHIRQGDYKRFMEGSLYFPLSKVADILRGFTKKYKGKKEPLFILCSDDKIDRALFRGLNIQMGIGSMVEDLFTLSRCDLILASNSSFSSFASYYGAVPLCIFGHNHYLKKRNPI